MIASNSGGLALQLTRPNGSPDLLCGKSSSEFSELSLTKSRTSRLSLSVELLYKGFMDQNVTATSILMTDFGDRLWQSKG